MTLSENEKMYLIIAVAALLVLWLVASWWRSGNIEAVRDIGNVSAQVARDVKDIAQEAKKQEGKIRDQKVQEVEALPGDDVAFGLDALLRGYRAGR